MARKSIILITCLLLSASTLAKRLDYSDADRRALAATPEVEGSVKTLARYLGANNPSAAWDPRVRFWVKNEDGDEYKARAIYRWVTDRIVYRVKIPDKNINNHEYHAPDGRYWSSEVSPDTTLKRREAFCIGYALLFQALAAEGELPVLYLEGTSYANGCVGEHAWNAVKIGEHWRMIDVTWGAGSGAGDSFRKKFDGRWFLVPPNQFRVSHIPSQKSLLEPCYSSL